MTKISQRLIRILRKELIPINIIYDIKTDSTRAVNFKEGVTYDLTSVNFYIPTSFTSDVYIKLEDDFGHVDMLKLTQTNNNKTYRIYNVSTTNSTINNLSKDVKLSLFYFVGDGIKMSDSFNISLDYKGFNFATQLSVVQAAAREMAENYAKVNELTQISLSIYKDILEVTNN